MWQQLDFVPELEYDLWNILDMGRKWLVDFKTRKDLLVSFNCLNNCGAIDVKTEGSALDEKSSFKML